MDDIFCKIIKGEVPTDFLFEDENLVVFKDINPSAPIHYLIVPRKHIATINSVESQDTELIGLMVLAAKRAAKELGTADGYKLVFNVGRGGGQIIDHIHLHLLGGWSRSHSKLTS